MRTARRVLIGIGVAGLIAGAWLLLTTVKPVGLFGLVIWFAVAIALHDAVLSPLLFAVGWLVRRTTRRVPLAAVAIVQVASVVGGIGSVLLLPAIHAKQLGTRNPTVLPLDYGAHLAGLWIVLAVVTAIGVAVVFVLQRHREAGSTGGPTVASASG